MRMISSSRNSDSRPMRVTVYSSIAPMLVTRKCCRTSCSVFVIAPGGGTARGSSALAAARAAAHKRQKTTIERIVAPYVQSVMQPPRQASCSELATSRHVRFEPHFDLLFFHTQSQFETQDRKSTRLNS